MSPQDRPSLSRSDKPLASSEAAPPRPLVAARQPLYVSLAQSILLDIEHKRYPVGSLLPTEEELASRYGLSRHTVRQALRELKEEGVIASHRGVGTRVRAPSEQQRTFGGIHTVGDLLQFVESTVMRVIDRKEIIANATLSGEFGCKPGQAWLQLTLLRSVADQKRPLGYLQVYMRPEHADAVGRSKSFNRPIYSHIEERYGVRIVEVLQEITAVNLAADSAGALKKQEGDAAMRITRHFLDRNGVTVMISIGHYPSGLYTQISRFRTRRSERE
jgi:GntR family transcriptional regulator